MSAKPDPLDTCQKVQSAFANAGLIQPKTSPPTTDELVEALRELREAEGALDAAVAAERAAKAEIAKAEKRASALAIDAGIHAMHGPDTGLCRAIAHRMLEDRQRPAKPDDTPARFHFGDTVEYKGALARVVSDDGRGALVHIRYPSGREAWRPRAALRLVVAAHVAGPEMSE